MSHTESSRWPPVDPGAGSGWLLSRQEEREGGKEAVSRLLLTGAATTQVLIYKEYMMELVIVLSQKKKILGGVSVRVIGEVGLRRKRKLNRWMKTILSQFW